VNTITYTMGSNKGEKFLVYMNGYIFLKTKLFYGDTDYGRTIMKGEVCRGLAGNNRSFFWKRRVTRRPRQVSFLQTSGT
jgi:hypothetical protein